MKTVSTIKLLFVVLVVAAMSSQTGIAQSSGGGRLAGTWDTVVTIRNCATNDPIVSFQSVGVFNQGGTFSGISSGQSPTARGPEAGLWKHVKGDTYQFRFKAYLFNAAGVATSYQVVTHELELDADALTWTSQGIGEVFNMSGTLLSTGCSSAEATRIGLE